MTHSKITSNKGQTGKSGFTLVELLVAISIIATLTAILLPNFMGAREKARDAKKKADMAAIKNALRMYYNDNQSYPVNQTAVTTALQTYAPQANVADYSYLYSQTSNGDGFQLCVDLDSAVGTEIADSQTKCAVANQVCGLGIGATTASTYVVCAN